MKNFISKLNTVKSIIRTNKTYETLLNWFTYWWKEKLSSLGMNNMERCQSNPSQCILGSVTDCPFNQMTLGSPFTLAPGEANRLSCFTNEAE